MWKVLFFLGLALPCYSMPTAVQTAARLEQDILDGKLLTQTNIALSNLIRTAAGELRKRGHSYQGNQMETEWFDTYQYRLLKGRDIGDHGPLSQWLADKYNMLEFLLGVEVCKALHFSDLKTFNYCIPVVFNPCNPEWDKEEYKRHFSEGSVYYGLVPTVSYWVLYGACGAATMGTGFIYGCGLAGAISEKLVAMFVAPRLSDFIWDKACGGSDA